MGVVVVLGRWRVFSVVVAVGLVVGAVVGCSSSVKPSGSTTSPTVSASPSPDPSASAAAVKAQVLAVYHRYWDAAVQAQRGNLDPNPFLGVATGAIVERWMSDSRELKGYGVVREGEPGFSKVTVVVNGDTATVFACVDNSTWVVPGAENGNVPDVLPGGVALERRDGGWIVVDSVKAPETLTC
jgi:hypothetical protein